MKRINKLRNCLKGFIFGGQHVGHVYALQDWKADLDWLSKPEFKID